MKNSNDLPKILDKFAQVKILVVGDVMLDRYWWGNASRLSPEAPVPVVALQKVSNIAGGAANVAANIVGLGAKVFLTGVVGHGETAQSLCKVLNGIGISPDFLVRSESRQTTTKTRVLVHNQQIARIDDETAKPLTVDEEEKLLSVVIDLIAKTDLIILSDYAKGCLTRTLVAAIVDQTQKEKKMVLVDPKGTDFTKYGSATLLTPNILEATIAAKIEIGSGESIAAAAEKILSETKIGSLLITLGEHGMKLFRRDGEPLYFPSLARQVFDVTGAGDTVIASLAVALGAEADVQSAIEIANIAAGLAVEKVGTSIVPISELRQAFRSGDFGQVSY